MISSPLKDGAKESASENTAFSPPSLSLPKGGGAIRSIGEKFAANLVTGTGSLNVPIQASPGRSGFGPQLSLSYDSGGGNGPFGFGWSLALPSLTRKTDKGLPQYADADQSDTFILSGAEDLVPVLIQDQDLQWTRDTTRRSVYGQHYKIHLYRPRVEGLFARIEHWVNLSDAEDNFWRSITKDNVTARYGTTAESRIADPADPTRIFSWLLCETYDDKGNFAVYQYKPENSEGVDVSQAHERNRSDIGRAANRYLKHVLYGNRTPYFPNLKADGPVVLPTDWCFELVFDYGEHDPKAPVPQEQARPWDCRSDPFSSYRATFEVRTYRLCRRVLMFHHFDGVQDVGLNCLVSSTDLHHAQPAQQPADPTKPFYSFLLSARHTGYRREGNGGYQSKSLPPLEFAYTVPEVNETVRDVDSESLQNLPYGLDGTNYQWADLDGEGVSGILTEQAGSWFYKPNLSPANLDAGDGAPFIRAQFGPVQLVRCQPSLAALEGGRQRLVDLAGDGHLDLTEFDGPTPGFFERTEDHSWAPFTPFRSIPVVDWKDANLRFVDLTGDGLPDLLISEDDAFWWYNSLGTEGFGSAQRVPQALDEEKGPKVVFSDGAESIFLADASGDGLADIVRVRNGEICYWPNLGYGRFGAKITMDQSPWFDRPELFDARRIQMADIDGSATSDLIYFASGAVHLYFNQSGNGWARRRALEHFPSVESVSTVVPLDLLGNGTACLVWSSPLQGSSRTPMRYIDLMGGQKPHLLVQVTNNLGAETRIQYAPSTRFYIQDKLAGTPWITRIPFPVHVVERVETYDYVSRNRFVTRYAYHHGYYDGVEREFRGFGRVEQYDTEEIVALSGNGAFPQATNLDPASQVPPVCTKTWFHTGPYFDGKRVSKHFEKEYYREGDASDVIAGLTDTQLKTMLLDDTVLPATIRLPDGLSIPYDPSPEELREACRTLRGSILRQEVYGLDGSDAEDRPYTVSERNYTIEFLQPQGPNRYAVFFTHSRETIDFDYDRELYFALDGLLADSKALNAKEVADPRVKHTLTLSVDPFGNVLESASIGYGRRYRDQALPPGDQAKQSATLCTYTLNSFTNSILEDDQYRAPLAAETQTFELLQVLPKTAQSDVTNLFRFDEIRGKSHQAGDGNHVIEFENLNPGGLNQNEPYRRLLGRRRTYFRPNDMGAAAQDPSALLPLGTLESLALPGSSYKLAFTPGLLVQVYQRGQSDLLPDPKTLLSDTTSAGGAYLELDGDGHWWTPSGRLFYLPAPDTPQNELAQAHNHFFLPRRFEDPFGNATSVEYDEPHDLLPTATRDAVQNTVTATNDYRVLQPTLMTDPNGNRTAVEMDVLGLATGTAVMGKIAENLGDSFAVFEPDPLAQSVGDFYSAADPHALAYGLLGTATARVVYDVDRFWQARLRSPDDSSQWEPVFAATIAREIHADPQSPLQISFSYSDGFGREIQKKIQAEPGPVVEGGLPVDPRWVGSGWTIFNNKGKPVRQYEPFFSQLPQGHQFEFGVQVGVSPILCYDPVERVVLTIHPDHSYEKLIFDPWRQETWDGNDTVTLDPKSDPDVGGYFQLLPQADFSPTWLAQKMAGSTQDQDAAAKASKHANTPTLAYLDNLGRAFLTVADNSDAGKYASRVELDIQGNHRSVSDAPSGGLNKPARIVMRYDYDILGNWIHQASMEAGERWVLNASTGKSIRAWDSRGHNFRTEYDALRRPTRLFVHGFGGDNSDPRTLNGELLYEQTIYGEGQPNDQELNLRTRLFQHFDTAGVATQMGINPQSNQNEAYDFKGNPLRSGRQFLTDYQNLANWSGAPPLDQQIFTESTQYDALNRPVAAVTPDSSVVRPTYGKANLLRKIDLNLRGAQAATSYVASIEYNARGKRVRIDYANHVATAYEYDPATFRLAHLITTREGFQQDEQVVQDLTYTYDPIGNITQIQDQADIHNVVFFQNRRVEPSNDYTYDAIYRLIRASGREQLGLNAGQPPPPVPSSYNDSPRVSLIPPHDGNALGTYNEQYQYDPAGNFVQFIHRGADLANPGWTRAYTYDEPSLLDGGQQSNRLTRTTVNPNAQQPQNEDYGHDLHGNMILMPQLQIMQWDFKDHLRMTQRQAVNQDDADGIQRQGERTYYVYDSAGQRVRKVTVRQNGAVAKQRIYLGRFEVYREYTLANVSLERETLHLMDEKRRVCLLETKTVDTNAAPNSLPGTSTRYQFDNHLGSACLELDEGAAVISYEEYYPFGSTSYQAVRSAAEVSLKRYRFTGKERDEETGFYYHGARYYACWLGRWTNPDPAGLVDGTNLWVYVRNRPIALGDFTGMRALPPEEQENKQRALTYAFEKSWQMTELGIANQSLSAVMGKHMNRNSGAFLRMYLSHKLDSEVTKQAGEDIAASKRFHDISTNINTLLQQNYEKRSGKLDEKTIVNLADRRLQTLLRKEVVQFRDEGLNPIIGAASGISVTGAMVKKTTLDGHPALLYGLLVTIRDSYDFENKRSGVYDRFRKELARDLKKGEYEKFWSTYRTEEIGTSKRLSLPFWPTSKTGIDKPSVFASFMYAIEKKKWTGPIEWHTVVPIQGLLTLKGRKKGEK